MEAETIVDNLKETSEIETLESQPSDEKPASTPKADKTEKDLNFDEKEQTEIESQTEEMESQTDEITVQQEIEIEPCKNNLETAEKDILLVPNDNCITDLGNVLLNTECKESEDAEVGENTINNNDDPKQRVLWASEKNEIDEVRRLLDADPTLVSAQDEDLYTPLHRACSNNHVEIVKLLLSAGADLSARTDDGWYPLHCACRWDSVEAASLLLQGGANVNAASKGGLTPLHLASANGSGRRTLELLLWHPHIDGSLRAENGDTAHDVACRTSNSLLRLFELLEESVNCF